MGEHTNIAWCDHTFNAWIGCAKVSAACKFCYAEIETFPRVQRGRGLELWGVNAARHVTSDANWAQVRRWNRAAIEAGERRRVFVNSMSDVMERPGDPVAAEKIDLARGLLYELIDDCQGLDFLLLTKRPENYLRLLPQGWLTNPRRNVWLGTTGESQETLNERAGHLNRTPARVRYLSIEPQLERVLLDNGESSYLTCNSEHAHCCESHDVIGSHFHGIDWVICGGESGSKARPFELAWARSLRDQCKAAGVAFFMKQLGSNPIDYTPAGYLPKHPKGAEPCEWPSDLRVREMPWGATP
jgi:protein gp37